MHYFIGSVFADMQDYGFGLETATSEANETVRAHLGALRDQILKLDKSVGQSVAAG